MYGRTHRFAPTRVISELIRVTLFVSTIQRLNRKTFARLTSPHSLHRLLPCVLPRR